MANDLLDDWERDDWERDDWKGPSFTPFLISNAERCNNMSEKEQHVLEERRIMEAADNMLANELFCKPSSTIHQDKTQDNLKILEKLNQSKKLNKLKQLKNTEKQKKLSNYVKEEKIKKLWFDEVYGEAKYDNKYDNKYADYEDKFYNN